MEACDKDAIPFYAVLAAYGEALRANLSPEQLRAVVRDANEYAIIGQSIEPYWESPADCMTKCVEDMRTLGGARTRGELLDAGVVDENGLELPR